MLGRKPDATPRCETVARMAELADAPDSKSGSRKRVGVRPSLRAPPRALQGSPHSGRTPAQPRGLGMTTRTVDELARRGISRGFQAGKPKRQNLFRTMARQEFRLTRHVNLAYIFACLRHSSASQGANNGCGVSYLFTSLISLTYKEAAHA